MDYTTHIKGVIGEMEFTIYLLKKGYTVLKPINPNSSYDLLIEKEGIYKKVQIKFLTPVNGRLRVEFKRPKRKKIGLYQQRGVDLLGVFNPVHNKFYMLPLEKFGNKSGIWIRISKTKNNQTKNINYADDYII